ncbi:uncharacterized protein TNCV_4780891 [Trichonephila clavipes]|nr:uncharacterized protein TNCV_4780891 [Trichonephila clavipes]
MDAKTATVLYRRAKAALTRTKNFIDKDDQTFETNDIRNKLEKLELTYTEFDKADAALPIESSEMEEFETKYYETKAKLQNILENLSVRTYVYNDNSDVFENVSNMKSSNFKLPKINIERFSGNYKDWPSFKDLYVSLVHDNMCLSNIQKFQYLRGLLLSEPANIIKHIPITETAYNEAWEKLLARYDKKKQIIFSLVKTFMEQPSFNDTNSSNLSNIADTSDEVIRGPKSMDTETESRDHAVIKPSSTTTKLRVVFDASLSCKTTNSVSLNSLLGVGPKLQRDIFEILLNFRIPKIVFTADIEKMYRQILVADEDQKYQKILWRNNSSENICTYKLKTVTYGLASASFSATRCIKEIALDKNKDNPNLSRVLQEDIYMNDLLSRTDTPNNTILICKDISHVLSICGFHLRKWNSNSTEFLAQFSEHSSHDT